MPTATTESLTVIRSDVSATLDQLKMVDERRRYLTARQHAMIDQITHRAGMHWRSGKISREELLAVYARLRDAGAVGFLKSWGSAGLPHIAAIQRDIWLEAITRPNDSDGAWSGTYPITKSHHRPPNGQSVVYLLYQDLEPIYLGSTDRLLVRLSAHARDGKPFTSWRAWPCMDREDAYRREEQMLREVLPKLNRRAGR